MDAMTLSLAKKYANKVAAGYSSVRVDGMNLIFTLNDGKEVTMTIPAPADGKDGISVQNLSIDNDGSLLCHMSDGSVIDAGKVPSIEVEYSWDNLKDKPFEEIATGEPTIVLLKDDYYFTEIDSELGVYEYSLSSEAASLLYSLWGTPGTFRMTLNDEIIEMPTDTSLEVIRFQSASTDKFIDCDVSGYLYTLFTPMFNIELIFIPAPKIIAIPEKFIPDTIATKEYVNNNLEEYYTKEEINDKDDGFYFVHLNIAHSSDKDNIAQMQKALAYIKTKKVAVILNSSLNAIPKFFYLGTNVANKDIETFTGSIKWYGEPQVSHIIDTYSGSYIHEACSYITAVVSDGVVTKVEQQTMPTENESVQSVKLPVLTTTGGDVSFNPTKDYHPATKKYVDDKIGEIEAVLATLTTPSSEGGN